MSFLRFEASPAPAGLNRPIGVRIEDGVVTAGASLTFEEAQEALLELAAALDRVQAAREQHAQSKQDHAIKRAETLKKQRERAERRKAASVEGGGT